MLLSACSRPLRGGRGLKRAMGAQAATSAPSPPARGAWIETTNVATGAPTGLVAPCAGGVD